MADGYAVLLDEVDRVVNSPYPTQLKASRQHPPSYVAVLTLNSPYETLPATSAPLSTSPDAYKSNHASSKRLRYACSRVCDSGRCYVPLRDALLNHEPSLLPGLLAQATPSDGMHLRYTDAALAILAHPLPDQFGLPAITQTLFLRLVERAVQEPSAESLKPVYSLLQGTSALMVGLLSSDVLSRLEHQLDAILRSNHNCSSHDSGDKLRTLHCLAIMHLIAASADGQQGDSFSETQELLASTQNNGSWTPAGMMKYFTNAGRVSKTIQLVVLQAMWACQAVSEPFDDRLAALRLANVLMGVVPAHEKDAWCAANSPVVQKLQQKALACHQSKDLQLHAFAFICQLCKPVALQCCVVEAIRHALSDPQTFVEVSYSELEAFWPHCMSAVMDGSTAVKLLVHIVDRLGHSVQDWMVSAAQSLTVALQQLAELSLENGDVADAARRLLATASYTHNLREVSSKLNGQEGELRSSVCVTIWRSARNKVVHGLSSLLLKCALQAQHSDSPLPASTLDILLNLHAKSAVRTFECVHRRARRQATQPLLGSGELERTPPDVATDWRSALQAHCASESRANHDALSKAFARACQDIEARCENVEQPLREEQAARARVQEECDQLQEAYNELEAQVVDRRLHYEALEAEKDGCLQSLDAAREENIALQHRVEGLHETLETTRREAEKALAEMRREKGTAHLQHAATLAKNQEELEDLHERCESMSTNLQVKSDLAKRLSSELHIAEAARDSLQTQVDHLEICLQDKAAEVVRLEQANGEGGKARAHLESELHVVRNELDQERRNHERHVQQVKEQTRQNAEAANASHNDAIDRMADQHGEEVANLERQIADGEQQIKRLQRKCRQKDDQIAEAHAMRSNLLAALGGGLGTQMPPTASLPHRTRIFSRTQAEPSNGELTPITPSFAMDMDSQAFDGRGSIASNASSTHSRNGPTPKRAKPRKSIKVASPAKTRLTVGSRTTRTSLTARSTAKRRPLSALNVNASPQKDAPKTPSKGTIKGIEDEFDDSTFDEHEVHLVTHELGVQDMDTMLPDDTEV